MSAAGWILNTLYGALLIAASPWIAYRRLRHGKDREGFRQKFLGDVPARPGARPCVWLHAVSVGEVLLLKPVLDRLRAEHGSLDIVLSTTTQTGQAVAREKYPFARTVYYPFDFTWAVRRALRRLRPDVVALVELELWPNFISAVHERGVPLVLLNGRISERSFRGYSRIRRLVAGWLGRFTLLTVQTEEYGERLQALGAPADRVVVTGSVKYDGLEHDRSNPRTETLRQSFGIRAGERVFIAGSTQAPEEQLAIESYRALRNEFPDLRLVVVPRHKERFEETAGLIERSGLGLRRRSTGATSTNGSQTDRPVLLLDTLGELSACWGLADIAFVGGSLSRRGGQNMLEPAAYGAAVLFGPNTFNFRHAVEMLLARNAARVVHSGEELTACVRELLRDEPARRAMGERARQFVLSQHGATSRVTSLLGELLPADPGVSMRRAG
ncbi:3-deoxy-D-manno-octulosonic acid transferase [Caulifigura coniformis]|uniref:3-deoxy-D-manno-octulosonic acid transferase n=1 Tax=Caulifigura coniformis TaxID=2527983 RepID=A0A517SDV8_9PLAN|nr:3-deoxy-D-manno-octulosonic acid transferase [Caulifigura coniformis]QDT54316.1 3-deoxy-D-manno-octulosonic acid transferase [Caulifigura coniformis]